MLLKKAGRIAAEGLSYAYISEDNSVAVAVEVNSETDFVAKNEKFQNFVKEVAQHVVTNNCANVDEFFKLLHGVANLLLFRML